MSKGVFLNRAKAHPIIVHKLAIRNKALLPKNLEKEHQNLN